MSRGTLKVIPLLALLVTAGEARAEGRFTLPLESPELPHGALTVKVVGKSMDDIELGVPVRLGRLEDGKVKQIATAETGEDGRARFDELSPNSRYVVIVEAGGETHTSRPFSGPQQGGMRLLLTLSAGAPMMPGTSGGTQPSGGRGGGAGGQMPAGHPPVAGQGRARPPASAGGAATVEPAEDLEPDQLQVHVVKGPERVPVAGATVELGRLARGRDGQLARFSVHARHETGAGGTSGPIELEQPSLRGAVVRVHHDGLKYHSEPLAPPEAGGLKLTFQVYDRTTSTDELQMGDRTHWISQLGEGVVRFMHLIQLVQGGSKIFDPGKEGLLLPLPRGAVQVEVPGTMRDILSPAPGQPGVILKAPVPPGELPLQVYFSVPYDEEVLELTQPLALPLERGAFLILGEAGVQLAGPAVAGQGRPNEGGRPGTLYPVSGAAAESKLEVALLGLPVKSRMLSWAAVALATLIALWGVGAARAGPARAAARSRRREELLTDLVRLRRTSRKKAKGTREREQRIIDKLRRVWDDPW